MLTIRPERLEDHEAVSHVIQLAFGRTNEAQLVEALRRSSSFISALSLAAFDGAEVVGHILFTRIVVKTPADSRQAVALAPVAVLPAFQRRGIGSALVRRGLSDAEA